MLINYYLKTSESEDYTNTINLLTFGPDTRNVVVRVPIVDDETLESDETFFGNLRIPLGTPNTGSILYQPGRATATIQDNDSKHGQSNSI